MLPLRAFRHSLRSSYCPVTRAVTVAPGASRFELAHERAHEQQDRQQHWLWRLDQRLQRPGWCLLPFAHRLTRIALELHATAHALLILHRLRLLDRRSILDAGRSAASYVSSLIRP